MHVITYDYLLSQAMKEDLQATQADLDDVQQTGDRLKNLVGDPDKPEVMRNIDDLSSNVSNITDELDKRAKMLEETLAKSMQFHDELMVMILYL